MYFVFMVIIFTNYPICCTQSIFIDPGSAYNEKVRGYVGSTFRHEIRYFKHEEATADRKELKLLTLDEKELFENTWIRLDVGEKVVYGFPLKGNEGTSTYLVKSITYTKQGEKKTRIKVNIFVKESPDEHFHEIKLCTSLTLDLFLKNVDIRYELAEMLSFYLLKTTPDNFHLKKYEDGCIWFSFKNIENGNACSFEKIDLLRRQLFVNGRISPDFSRSIEHVTTVKSVNFTLNGPCIRPTTIQTKHDLHWVKTVAPILILLAIVGIPVSISCYVCRGVRRRQNKMRQQQDKLAREDQIRLNEQMQEYREACGLDDAEESDTSDSQNQVKWKKDDQEEKQIFLARLFEQYMPQSLQDKFDIGKSVFDYTKQKSTQAKVFKKPLNPVSRILDIRSTTVMQAQARAADPIYTKTRMNAATNGNILNSSALATSNLNLMKKLGCNASLLSINYKNKEVDPRLDSWRRLNSAIAISNSITGGKGIDEQVNLKKSKKDKEHVKGIMTPGEDFRGNSIYRKNSLVNIKPHESSTNNHYKKSMLKEQCRGKSVSFYDVSNKDGEMGKQRDRVRKVNEKVTSFSCENVSKFAEYNVNNNKNNTFPRRPSRSIQTQTANNNVIGSMKNLATSSKQKLKATIRNGKILRMQTRDCATSPPPSNYMPLKRLSKRRKYKNDTTKKNASQNIPLLENEVKSSMAYYSSPRDTFIPEVVPPAYSTLYPMETASFVGSNNEVGPNLLDDNGQVRGYYHNYLLDEVDKQTSFDHSPPYDVSSSDFIDSEQYYSMDSAYIDSSCDNRQNFYYDSRDVQTSYDYTGEESQSLDSTVNQSSIDHSSSFVSDSTSPLTADELARIALRRRMFQQHLPQIYNSFEVFPDSRSLSPSSENFYRRRSTLPTFSYDGTSMEERDSQNLPTSKTFVPISNSVPMKRKKERWKSFESGSSEVTYVDFGSEYEMKTPTNPYYPSESFNFDVSSCSTTPTACQSPIYFRARECSNI